MAFHIGQKVVCIDADPTFINQHGNLDMDGLTKGCVYTIRAIGEAPFWGGTSIWLEEIHRSIEPLWMQLGEMPYDVRRFRPVVEKKTDISIFTAMLTPSPKQVERVT
jgi:hypothetical protein